MKKIYAFLKDWGLSAKEIDIYLTTLKSGPMTATEIAKACKLTRPNAYDVLANLKEKGMAKEQGTQYGKKFIMSSPIELHSMLQTKKKNQEDMENKLLDLIPYFNQLGYGADEHGYQEKLFVGQDAIKKLLNYLQKLEKTPNKISVQIYA